MTDYRQSVNVMQSDHPEFWSASAHLPIMTALKAGMDRTHFKVFSAADCEVKIDLSRGSLHPIAIRVLDKMKAQVDINRRHVEACLDLAKRILTSPR